MRIDEQILFLKVFICIFITAFTLYAYIDKQNELTELRLVIPALVKKVKNIQEENNQLKYEIECFENPVHLMELLRKPEFGHLHFTFIKDVLVLPEKDPKEMIP